MKGFEDYKGQVRLHWRGYEVPMLVGLTVKRVMGHHVIKVKKSSTKLRVLLFRTQMVSVRFGQAIRIPK